MSDTIICPACGSEFTYENGDLMACSQCFHKARITFSGVVDFVVPAAGVGAGALVGVAVVEIARQ